MKQVLEPQHIYQMCSTTMLEKLCRGKRPFVNDQNCQYRKQFKRIWALV